MELNDTKKKNKHKERFLKVWNALKGGKKKNSTTANTRRANSRHSIPILFIGPPSSGLAHLFIESISNAYNINLDDHQKNQILFRESLTKDPRFLSFPTSVSTITSDSDGTTNYLSLLPPEILTRVLALTNLPDLLNISTLIKSFAEFLREDEFWRRYFGPVQSGADPAINNYKALLRNYQEPFEVYATTTDLFKIHFRSAYEFQNLQKFEEMTYFVTCVDTSRFDDEEYIDNHLHIVSQHVERQRDRAELGFPIMVVFTRVGKLTQKLADTRKHMHLKIKTDTSSDRMKKSADEVIEELKQRYNNSQDKFEAQYAMDEDGFVWQPFLDKKLLLEVDRGDLHKILFDTWEKFNQYTTSYVD